MRDRVFSAHLLGADGYRCEQWVIGDQVTEEVYHRLKDEKGDLYVSIAYVEGEPHTTVVKRELWWKLMDDIVQPSRRRERPVVECPECGQKLRVPSEGRGRVVCPNCKSRLTADAVTGTVMLERSTLDRPKDVSFEEADDDSLVTKPQERVSPPSRAMTYRLCWALALLAGALLWADLWNVALDKSFAQNLPIASRFGVALGMSGPFVARSGILAAIVWAITRKPNAAMWTWTILLLIGLTVMSIGGVQVLSKRAETPQRQTTEAEPSATENVPPSGWGFEEQHFDSGYGTPYDPTFTGRPIWEQPGDP